MISKLRYLITRKQQRDFAVYGLGQSFNLLSPLIVAPILIKVCGEAGFGKIGFGFGLSLFLILIVDYGFEIKGVKAASEIRNDTEKLKHLVWTTFFTKFLLFIVTMFLAVILVASIPFFRSEAVLFILSMSIVFAQVFNPTWLLQGLEMYTAGSLLNIFSKLFYVGLVFLFVTDGGDYVLANLFLGISALTVNALVALVILRKLKLGFVWPQREKIFKILSVDFRLCMSQLMLSVRQLSPLFLVGFIGGFQMAGQYKILEQILTLVRTYNQVFLRFFYPKLCYHNLKSYKSGLVFWRKYAGLNIMFVIAGLSVVCFYASEVLLFFNVSDESVAELVLPLRLMLVVCGLIPVSLSLEQLLFSLNLTKIYSRIVFAVATLNVLLLSCLILPLGLYGVIVSLLVAEAVFIIAYWQTVFGNKTPKQNSQNSLTSGANT